MSPPIVTGRGRIRWIIAAITAIVLVCGCLCGGVLVSPLGSEVSPFGGGGKPARRLAIDARHSIEAAAGVRYSGAVRAPDGDVTTLDVTVARDGSSAGTMTRGSGRAELLRYGGGTFLRGNDEYWTRQHPPSADVYRDRWANAGTASLGFDLGSTLNPATLGATIQRRVGESGPSSLAKRGLVDIGGTRAVRISTKSGLQLYVAASSPHRLLRLTGAMQAGGMGGGAGGFAPDAAASDRYDFTFDVESTSEQRTREVSKKVRRLAAVLGGAPDPNRPETLPARYTIASATPNCGANACAVNVRVRNLYGPPARGTRGTMLAQLSAHSVGGPLLGACPSTPIPSSLAGGRSTVLRCAVVGGAWSAWTRTNRRTGGTYAWSVVLHSPGWSGPNPALLQRLLDKRIDSNLITRIGQEHGKAGLETFDRLMALPAPVRKQQGIAPERAHQLIADASELKVLGDVRRLVASGRLHHPRQLWDTLDKAKKAANPAESGHLEEIREAARRASTRGGPIAIEAWRRSPGTSQPAYRADVIDVGRREALQLKRISSTNTTGVVSNIRKAGRQIGGMNGEQPPPGFRRIIKIFLESPTNDMYMLPRRALLQSLRKANVQRATLGPADELQVVNGTGHHVFRRTELP